MVNYTNFQPNRPNRAIASILLIFTIAGAFWAGMFPIRGSNDPWWHLKTGKILWQYFQAHGFSFPPFDVFTYTGAATPWVNHEWLADLIFYAAYAIGGIQGAIVLKSLILALTFALFAYYIRRLGAEIEFACLGALIALLASLGTIFLRPPIFTYLFVVVFLHLILTAHRGGNIRRTLLLAAISEIVWINLHGGAILGIILIGFWWVSEFWFCSVDWLKGNPVSLQRLKTSSLFLSVVTAASFVNPFTYHIHLLPFKIMKDQWLIDNIGEMQTPNMQYRILFKLIIVGSILFPMLRRSSIRLYEGLAIVFFLHQSLNHQRHIPLFALIATPPFIHALAESRRSLLTDTPSQTGSSTGLRSILQILLQRVLHYRLDAVAAFLLIAYAFGAGPHQIWRDNLRDFRDLAVRGYIPDRYPEKPANFLIYNKIQGPMFNHDNYAGYLIWRFAPERMKVFTDSRYDLWGSRYAKEELGAFGGRRYPLGCYARDGVWYDFDPYRIKKREDVLVWEDIYAGTDSSDPDIVAWYESGKEYWQYILDKYNVNFIICVDIKVLHYQLDRTYQGWFLVYHEGGYVIYLRNTPDNANLIRKYALNHQEHIPSMEDR